MSYCILQDLIDRYGETELIQLSDNDGVGEIDSDVINRAIADADGEIDGYLAPKFGAPLPVIPKAIELIACDIARYYLYADRVDDVVKERYANAVRRLKGIRDGQIDIGIDALGAEPVRSGDSAQMESGGRVFGRDGNGFI